MNFLNLNHQKTAGDASSSNSSSTQSFVDVNEVKDGVIVLKDHSLRAILLVSSINFDLKSRDEQDAIVYKYQNFLNSLDFFVQIVISSRRLNLDSYLEMLKNKEIQQVNELLKFQTDEYRKFVKSLIDISNIMTKHFYIVVPFYPTENKNKGFFGKITDFFSPEQAILEQRELFETYKDQLWQRVDHIISGLSGIGLQIVPLQTDEIIELLYNSYNPATELIPVARNVNKIKLEN